MFNVEKLPVNFFFSDEETSSKLLVLLRLGQREMPLTEDQQKVLAKYFAKIFVAQVMTGLYREEDLAESKLIFTEIFGGPELRLEHKDINGSLNIQTVRISPNQIYSAPIKLLIPEISVLLGRNPRKTELGLVWNP